MVSKIKRLPPGIRLTSARTIRGTSFLLKIQKTHRDIFRIGFVITKKIDKRATRRNRLRRILSSEIEHARFSGYDILCILTKPIQQEGEESLRKEFKTLLTENI